MCWCGKVTFLLYGDCNKMFAFEIINYFKKQINRKEVL